MPTPSFILPTSVPVVDATVEALRVYDGSPAGFDVLPMSFTRASTATRTDSAGNIVEAVPYNLAQYSEQFDNAAWGKTQATVTANAIAAPNGTLTADTFTASSSFPRIAQTPTIQANQSYRISVYAKAGSASVFTIFVSVNSVALVNNVQYDLLTGVVIGAGAMQAVGDGWYLCSATFTVGASTASPDIRFYNHAQGVANGWSGTNFIYGWGAQIVVGTQPLPYQETVTRLALPRLDYRNADGTLSSTPRLLLEPQRTNSIRNSTMVGAVAGTPGTLPTNYLQLGGGGLTRTVSLGVENGLQYIDLRYQGTSTDGFIEWRLDTTTAIAALPSQVWSFTNYLKLVSGTMPNAFTLNVYARNAAAGVLQTWNTPASITSSLNRFQNIITATPANTAFIQNAMFLTITNGAAYDFTIRIAAPQMELGSFATTFIPTSTAAVTRLADACSVTGVADLIGQTEGTIFAEVYISQLQGAVARTLIDIGSTNNRIFVGFTGEASNTMRLQIDTSVSTVRVDFRAVIASVGTIKVAAAYKNGDCALYVNGVAGTQVANNSFSFTTLSNLVVGQTISGTALLNDGVSKSALYTTRLSNSELQSLTTL